MRLKNNNITVTLVIFYKSIFWYCLSILKCHNDPGYFILLYITALIIYHASCFHT